MNWLVDFNACKIQYTSFDHANNSATNVKMHGSVFEEQLYFQMLGRTGWLQSRLRLSSFRRP